MTPSTSVQNAEPDKKRITRYLPVVARLTTKLFATAFLRPQQ